MLRIIRAFPKITEIPIHTNIVSTAEKSMLFIDEPTSKKCSIVIYKNNIVQYSKVSYTFNCIDTDILQRHKKTMLKQRIFYNGNNEFTRFYHDTEYILFDNDHTTFLNHVYNNYLTICKTIHI